MRLSEQEFNELYCKYSQMLYNIIYSYIRNKIDSEDILQDVFMSYLFNSKVFKTKDEEKYWLIRITINRCINELKSYNRKNVLYNDELIATLPSENLDNSLRSNYIYNEVCKLPNKYKEVIILYYYNEMKSYEISKVLKISESAVRMRLLRGKEILKNKIGGNKND